MDLLEIFDVQPEFFAQDSTQMTLAATGFESHVGGYWRPSRSGMASSPCRGGGCGKKSQTWGAGQPRRVLRLWPSGKTSPDAANCLHVAMGCSPTLEKRL